MLRATIADLAVSAILLAALFFVLGVTGA